MTVVGLSMFITYKDKKKSQIKGKILPNKKFGMPISFKILHD